MVRWLAVLAAISILGGACSLLPPMACPGALLQGELAQSDDGTAVVITEFGEQRVTWPDGYRVDLEPELVLRDAIGRAVAVEGDAIYVGGGQDPDDPDAFKACGHVSRDPPGG
jgi:hypothetical protein